MKKKKHEIQRKDKINEIKIIIDHQVESFYKLFDNCRCIKLIEFKKILLI